MQLDESKWLWLDLEMTGLDPEADRIIEAAAIVTDTDLNELASWSVYVSQSDHVLDRMRENDWYEFNDKSGKKDKIGTVYDMHKQSGVLEKVKVEGIDEKTAQKRFVEFIDRNFDGLAILAGNSIHQDRRFIRRWWPEVEEKLHYRMLDVTAFKIVLKARLGEEIEKHETHSAIGDIRESIDELQYCLEQLAK